MPPNFSIRRRAYQESDKLKVNISIWRSHCFNLWGATMLMNMSQGYTERTKQHIIWYSRGLCRESLLIMSYGVLGLIWRHHTSYKGHTTLFRMGGASDAIKHAIWGSLSRGSWNKCDNGSHINRVAHLDCDGGSHKSEWWLNLG